MGYDELWKLFYHSVRNKESEQQLDYLKLS